MNFKGSNHWEPLNLPLSHKIRWYNFLEELNLTNFVNLSQVRALFGNSINIVISPIETSTVVSTIPIRHNNRMNISPGKECWDAPFSLWKKPSRYTHFRNQTYMKKQEEERAAKSNFCPRCKTKHPEQECPLKKTSTCHICMGHHVFPQGIKVDPTKIEVTVGIPSPKTLPPPDP